MNSELEMKLQADFPFMQRESTGVYGNIYRRRGFECDDGWYTLIYELCNEITKAFELEDKPANIIVKQVKEKFGKLRFYYAFGDDLLSSDDERDILLRSEIKKTVKAFEERSANTCEICGESGYLRKDTIIKSLCDNCYISLLNKKRKVDLNEGKNNT